MDNVAKKVREHIKRIKFIYTNKLLKKFPEKKYAVFKELSRLEKEGTIKRIRKGLYINNKKNLSLEEIIKEVVGEKALISGKEWEEYKRTGKKPQKIIVKSPQAKWYKSITLDKIKINIYPFKP